MHGGRQLVGQLWRHLHEPAEDVHDGAAMSVDLSRRDRLVRGRLDPRGQIRLCADEIQQPDSLDALDHQAQASIGCPSELMDHSDSSNTVEILGLGRLRFRIALGHQHQEAVAPHDIVHEPNGPRLGYDKRGPRQWEHNYVSERQNRERIRDDEIRGATARLDGHHPALTRLGSVMRSRPRS